MNELLNNFINQIDDVNKVKEMSVEEFIKLVKSNNLISVSDAEQLIESFKKISSKKDAEDESSDNDERKKKYREQQKNLEPKVNDKKENAIDEKEYDIER